jgi:electron transport complex protein RnfE
MSIREEFAKGIFKENPVFRLVLGMCPVLAVTTSALNGAVMGLAATSVLLGSSVVISIVRKLIPQKVRIPVFIVVIATFVTIVDFVIHGASYKLYKALGIFIPLIVVNCIILARAEAFASKHTLLPSITDGVGMGVGFTFSLILLGSVREILGAGTLFGYPLFGPRYLPFIVMILPPGAFIVLGLMLGIMNKIGGKK